MTNLIVFFYMRFSLRRTPQGLVALTCLGSVLSVGGFFNMGSRNESLVMMIISAAFIVGGFVLLFSAPYSLRDGIRNNRWPAEQFDSLRRVVEHPAWQAGVLTLGLLMIGTFLLGRRYRIYFWMVFLLLQTMTQISSAFRSPSLRAGNSTRLDWTKVPPLHSNHWGER